MPHRPEAYTQLISAFLYPLYQHDTDHKKPDPFPCRTLLSCPENLTGAVKPPPCNCSSFSCVLVALIRLRHLSWTNSRFQCMIGKWNRSKFQLYKQTHLEIHWSAVRIWGKGQFSNLRPLASSKPPNRATPSTSFTTSHNVQARWCFHVKARFILGLATAL